MPHLLSLPEIQGTERVGGITQGTQHAVAGAAGGEEPGAVALALNSISLAVKNSDDDGEDL